jgi:predicted XRE-type DNA-binding protein
LDSRGGYVVWIEDDLEMAADNLRNLAIEQAAGIGHERLANWMAEHGLTQERAADAIGISRRMLNYYLAGSRPISKTVWLAYLGWAAERKERSAAA